MLRFLADESCDFSVVRALRASGYNVLAVSEFMSRSVDRELIELAVSQQRILLTEDKDFGWLVYANDVQSSGVILIRFPGQNRTDLQETIVKLVETYGEKLIGAFAVMQPGYSRIRFKPDQVDNE